MQTVTEKKLVNYTALFIAFIFNISKLMALRQDAFIAQYWHFNALELLFQAVSNFALCIAAAYINMRIISYSFPAFKTAGAIFLANVVVLFLAAAIGIAIQTRLFYNDTPMHIFRAAYALRLLASQALMGVLVKIILLLRESKAKDKENERLRSAYLNAQLELLKDELNPHFFFNTLSSLSAIVREDPKKAQQYISHLSKVFRYTLSRHEKNLVPLKDELEVFDSYAALLKLRLEGGINIQVNIPQQYLYYQLPYMSLQPLLENVTKHNTASAEKPLTVSLFIEDGALIIQNNLQPSPYIVESTGIGLSNLQERFKILLHKDIEIQKTSLFIVKIPLQAV